MLRFKLACAAQRASCSALADVPDAAAVVRGLLPPVRREWWSMYSRAEACELPDPPRRWHTRRVGARVLGSCLAVAMLAGCWETHPCRDEVCDGRDNDCDGKNDEDFLNEQGLY